MKKNRKNSQKRKASLKRATKRGNRLKSTQKEKSHRKQAITDFKKKTEEQFEKKMRDLFGNQ